MGGQLKYGWQAVNVQLDWPQMSCPETPALDNSQQTRSFSTESANSAMRWLDTGRPRGVPVRRLVSRKMPFRPIDPH